MSDRRARSGSIPACAGEPGAPAPPPLGYAVYPRVCGGTASGSSGSGKDHGLSPRVRGNRQGQDERPLPRRSIPACAGEPRAGGPGRACCRVYPRVCGGTHHATSRFQSLTGLSPRVRGNPSAHTTGRGIGRSIPACAGEPPGSGRTTPPKEVYPRVCGGTPEGSATRPSNAGLSPRVRGNPGGPLPAGRASGSIPACAGEPTPGRPAPRSTWVYPRVCGGTSCWPSTMRSKQGLSPRVRGNLLDCSLLRLRMRSIPACAGEPEALAVSRSVYEVYPRVCGGTIE